VRAVTSSGEARLPFATESSTTSVCGAKGIAEVRSPGTSTVWGDDQRFAVSPSEVGTPSTHASRVQESAIMPCPVCRSDGRRSTRWPQVVEVLLTSSQQEQFVACVHRSASRTPG